MTVAIGVPFFFFLKWGRKRGTELVAEAIQHIEDEKHEIARQVLLLAVRLDGRLKTDPLVKRLYDICLYRNLITPLELNEIRTSFNDQRSSEAAKDPWQAFAKPILVVILGLSALFQLIAILGRK